MSITSKGWDTSDSSRDAQRYHNLLLTIDFATHEIRDMGGESPPDIDETLDRLLPYLAAALNAKQAFVAVLREGEGRGKKWLELTAVHPGKDLRGHRLECSELLRQLIKDGKPRVIDPLGEESRDSIPGLEIFEATSAILVRMEVADHTYITGICNKANPDRGPYLAADRMALDNIIELVAMGARVGERRRRELESIQETSAAISAELDLDGLLPMVAEKAAEVFCAPATSLMLWDEAEEDLYIRASWGLSDKYVQQQCIPKVKAYAAATPNGRFHPIVTPDLRLEPFGQQDLIKAEHLCSALSAPLLASGRPIGVLNIYSKDRPRQFTPYEVELSQIFANQAAIAIQNARQYEALREAQDELLAAGAIAWMGLFGSEWSHTVAQKTYSIRNYVDTLKDTVVDDNPLVKQALDSIDIIAQEIQDVPLTIPSPADTEKGNPIRIDPFVSRLLGRWCEPHGHVHLELDLCCGNVLVRADETLLKMALQKLVDNATRSMPNGGTLRVESRVMSSEFVGIALQDTGCGIPNEYQPFFGCQRIPKRGGDSGSGMGALLARFILRKYGGDLELAWSEKGKGTRLEITLPVCECKSPTE